MLTAVWNELVNIIVDRTLVDVEHRIPCVCVGVRLLADLSTRSIMIAICLLRLFAINRPL